MRSSGPRGGLYRLRGEGGKKVSIFSSAGKYGCYWEPPHPLPYCLRKESLRAPAPRGAGASLCVSLRRHHSGGGVLNDSILLTRGSGENEYLLPAHLRFAAQSCRLGALCPKNARTSLCRSAKPSALRAGARRLRRAGGVPAGRGLRPLADQNFRAFSKKFAFPS